jgi:hypothetical protein
MDNSQAQLAVQAARPVATGAGGQPRSHQLLVPLHREVHPRYGPIEITHDDVARMAQHFADGVKTYAGKVPFSIEHDETRGAAGWITGVEAGPEGLWGEVAWTPSGVKAIDEQQFPFISPELLCSWTDPVTQLTYRDVFEGASLVVRPEFRDLPPAVVQHYSEDPAPTVWVVEKPMNNDSEAATPLGPPEIGGKEPGAAATPLGPPEIGGKEPGPPAAARPSAAARPPDFGGTTGGSARPPEFGGTTGGSAAPEVISRAEHEELQRRFAEQRQRLARLEREGREQRFAEVVGRLRFGERAAVAPVSRQALARLGADLHEVDPRLARRFEEALGAMQTVELGERGLAPRDGERDDAGLDPQMQRFGEQLGMTAEEMKRGRETTTWRH